MGAHADKEARQRMTVYGEGPQEPEVFVTQSGAGCVRFEAIGEAWGIIKGQLGNWVLATLIYFILSVAVSMATTWAFSAMGVSMGMGSDWIGNLVNGIPDNIVSTLLNAFLTAGMWRMALNHIRTGTVSLNDLFSGADVFGPMVLNYLLTYLIVLGPALLGGVVGALLSSSGNSSLLLIVVPVIVVVVVYLSERLFFASALIVDRRLSAVEALKVSWKETNGHVFSFILFSVALGVLATLVCVFTCMLGVLVVVPLVQVAMAVVYRDLFPDQPAIEGPTLDMPLPPPSAYE